MTAYYSENDPFAAQWLRNLIAAGQIAPGEVDERSIADVAPDDLLGFRQVHLFAGIGGWSLALRMAGWPDDRPVWSGSCPCQPFSAAGKGEAFDDARHLWPEMGRLIAAVRPATVMGEQVDAAVRWGWLDLVFSDLERLGYACRAADIPAAGIGAPHIRQRLWWRADREGVEHAASDGWEERRAEPSGWGAAGGCGALGLANSDDARLEGRGGVPERPGQCATGAGGLVGEVGNANGERAGRNAGAGLGTQGEASLRPVGDMPGASGSNNRPGPTNGQWRDTDWLGCRDGKWRPVEPGSQQMVDGLSRGMGRLRADCTSEKEINDASTAAGFTGEVLRAVRKGHGAQTIWRSLGGRIGFPAATLLLSALCEQERELGDFFGGAPPRVPEGTPRELRALRDSASAPSGSSQGPEFSEQCVEQLGDALSKLSQSRAPIREHLNALAGFTGGPLADGLPGRVGRLRAYGNAIVPQVAAAVITATEIAA